MESVSRRIGRREWFRVAGGSAALAAAAQASARADAPEARGLPLANLADLTHPLSSDFPVFPGYDSMAINPVATVAEDGFYANHLELAEHTGTHLDAPAHFAADGATVDELPLETLFAPIAVIDIRERAAGNPDATVAAGDITAWEDEHGPLPNGAAVLMRSGWDARAGNADAFLNMDDEGVMHFPGFSQEAAQLLVEERNIAGVGVDTLSLDPGPSETFDAHIVLLGAGKWGLENVANLGGIPPSGAHLLIGLPKIKEGSGAPVRLIAAWE